MSNTFDKLSVLDSFIEEVNSYLPEIETNLERLAQSPGDMDALEETYRRTHTIGGSASMMDFPGLAHVAHGMEDILGDALDGLISLDEPALGLLQRSLSRLHQLLEGIRSGIDEDAVIAEDDADYSRYRSMMEASTQSGPNGVVENGYTQDYGYSQGPDPFVQTPSLFDAPASTSSSAMPSFDEVLASFRTPTLLPGEEVAWPEEHVPTSNFESIASQALPQMEPYQTPEESSYLSLSALDALVASTRQPPAVQPPSSPSTSSFIEETEPAKAEEEAFPAMIDINPWSPAAYPPVPVSAQPLLEQSEDDAFSTAYTSMQRDTQTLSGQAVVLRDLLQQLRASMLVIEEQRGEFKGFLDGSKDALDRMEDWAGQAMGLDLRNSPEQVRRYLPLSVMWVANSKLKKVLDLLNQITGGVTVTEEQMSSALQQLQYSIASCGDAFQQAQRRLADAQAPSGWGPWQMEVARDAQKMRERVTFEREGDPIALRAEIEAALREELRREYESRSVSLASRAELEQQIRAEVRQEFEEQRRLQERVRGPEVNESVQELEARLRNEIEIQVRQEFLNQIMPAGASAPQQQTLMREAPAAPTVSNFLDRASEETGLALPPMPSSAPMTPPPAITPSRPVPPLPRATAPAAPAATPAPFTGDFSEEAAEIFRLEAEEHLQTISMHVAALEKAPTNLDLIQGVRRATHTLKGAAGMMGFRAIADLCHVSEDLLDSIMEGHTPISSAVLSIILDTAETLDILITGRSPDSQSDEARVQVMRVRYAELLGEQNTSSYVHNEEDLDVDIHDDPSLVSDVVSDQQATETNAQRVARGDLSVRVRLQKLDELVNLFGELLVNRSVLEERIQRLVRLVSDVGVSSNRLRDVGQKLESRFEAATLPSGRSVQVMPGEGDQSLALSNGAANGKGGPEPSHLAEFDELELDRYTEFHQLARGLSEGISDMATLSTEMEAVIRECESVFSRENRLSTTFQDRLMKVRLVPLSTMTPRLYRAARAVALKQRKEFEFLLEGEATEVDRTVFEEIAGPLLHLMRNAVNHALETPDVRARQGKSPAGQIKLSAAYEGNQVVITVRDDGTGIDPEHVRNTAIHRGLIRPDQVLSDSDLIELIFRSGFSTASVLSEESGRGVGLDVVRDSVSRLRGTLVVESTPGQGTAFIMKFPTSLAIQSAMMVVVAGQQFAIPTVMVETIGRLDGYKRTTLGGQPAVVVQNDLYPLQTLSNYLSLSNSAVDDKAPILLVNASGNRVALMVDEVRGKYDIVMKNLGPHLRHVHGIAGGTVLGNGHVVLVLELAELLSSRVKGTSLPVPSTRREGTAAPAVQVKQSVNVATGRTAAPQRPTTAAAQPERGKHILVVDDSPSVRRVVSSMLKQYGWEVQTARDGIEALEMISAETPAAALLDIEMPRMDGYELIATVRAQEQYRTLPLVVLTSRAAAKHQQRAIQLGASAYVVKPYQDEELINTLNALVYGAVVR